VSFKGKAWEKGGNNIQDAKGKKVPHASAGREIAPERKTKGGELKEEETEDLT